MTREGPPYFRTRRCVRPTAAAVLLRRCVAPFGLAILAACAREVVPGSARSQAITHPAVSRAVPERLASLCVSADDSASTVLATVPEGTTRAAPVRTHLLHTSHAASPSALRCVVRQQSQWQAAWETLVHGYAPASPPAVDFTKSTIVIATFGEVTWAGPTISLDSVARRGDDGILWVTRRTTGAGCPAGDALTQPMDVIQVPRIPGSVRFVERWVQDPPCG